jgi:hypothetical protein
VRASEEPLFDAERILVLDDWPLRRG